MTSSKRITRLIVFVCATVGTSISNDDSNYLDWLVKSVCVTESGELLSDDPYYGCSSGAKARKVVVGDKMMYNNYEQFGYQASDSFVTLDADGRTLYMHNFDYAPFNEYNQFSGSDGYDVYAIINNAISISNTKDGGGYGSTFFGSGCTFGNGWAIFPTTNFLADGQGYWPISGVYWEHGAQSSPGKCPSGYSTNTLTSWGLVQGFSFGGINGNPTKSMDTVISYHGFETEKNGKTPTDNFLKQGHLEVFYYTQYYGLTRWEVWTPDTTQAPNSDCNGGGLGSYKGINFVIVNCHDWSNVKPAASPKVPEWPIVNSNLLVHGHFDSGLSDPCKGAGFWCRFGTSPAENTINWSQGVSTTGGDANNGGPGVAYLATNCAAGADGQCGTPGSQAIYQDVSISEGRVCAGCKYLFGANARTQPGDGTGSLQIAIQLLGESSATGAKELNSSRFNSTFATNQAVFWQAVFSDSVSDDNGDGRGSEGQSVYLSPKFVHSTATLPDNLAGATTLRFLIMPTTPNTFQIADAFLNRFG